MPIFPIVPNGAGHKNISQHLGGMKNEKIR